MKIVDKLIEDSLQNSGIIKKLSEESDSLSSEILSLKTRVNSTFLNETVMNEIMTTIKNLTSAISVHNKSIARLAEMAIDNQNAILDLNATQIEIAKALRGNSLDTKLPSTNSNKTSKPN